MCVCLFGCREPAEQEDARLVGAASVHFNRKAVKGVGTRGIIDDDRQVVTVRITMTLIRSDIVAVYTYLRIGDVTEYSGSLQLNHLCDWTRGCRCRQSTHGVRFSFSVTRIKGGFNAKLNVSARITAALTQLNAFVSQINSIALKQP